MEASTRLLVLLTQLSLGIKEERERSVGTEKRGCLFGPCKSIFQSDIGLSDHSSAEHHRSPLDTIVTYIPEVDVCLYNESVRREFSRDWTSSLLTGTVNAEKPGRFSDLLLS